jgi:hypothetical protein
MKIRLHRAAHWAALAALLVAGCTRYEPQAATLDRLLATDPDFRARVTERCGDHAGNRACISRNFGPELHRAAESEIDAGATAAGIACVALLPLCMVGGMAALGNAAGDMDMSIGGG